MNYDINAALLEIERRAEARVRRREQRRVRRMAAGCLALTVFLIVVTRGVVRSGEMPGRMANYGAYLLPVEAGSYVLVGVICFVAAVVITLLCVRWRGKH